MGRAQVMLLVLLSCLAVGTFARRDLNQADWENTFPPYGCNRNPDNSPFALQSSYKVDGTKICFTAQTKSCVGPSRCCTAPMQFYKLELQSRPQCRRAVEYVTLNGQRVVMPTFDFFGPQNSMAYWKIVGLNLNTSNADNAEICLYMRQTGIDICPTMEQLCPEGDGTCTYAITNTNPCDCCPVNKLGLYPPPPSPPPPSPPPPLSPNIASPPPPMGWPYCKCETVSAIMPYRMASTVVKRDAGAYTHYCFTMEVTPCVMPNHRCCNTVPGKVEWWSTTDCAGSVRMATINGTQVATSWDSRGVVKVTNLNRMVTRANAHGTEICIAVTKTSTCNTLTRLCNKNGGKCTYAFFDPTSTCCPTYTNILSNI